MGKVSALKTCSIGNQTSVFKRTSKMKHLKTIQLVLTINILQQTLSINRWCAEDKYMPNFDKEEEGYVPIYDYGNPSDKAPNVLNLNRPASCSTSASNYYKSPDKFISVVQKAEIQKIQATTCQI